MIIGAKCVQMLQQPTAVKMRVATASLAPLGQARSAFANAGLIRALC